MLSRVGQGLLFGAVAGAAIGVGFSVLTGVWWCMLLCPFTAVMGAAPQLLKPADMDDDD